MFGRLRVHLSAAQLWRVLNTYTSGTVASDPAIDFPTASRRPPHDDLCAYYMCAKYVCLYACKFAFLLPNRGIINGWDSRFQLASSAQPHQCISQIESPLPRPSHRILTRHIIWSAQHTHTPHFTLQLVLLRIALCHFITQPQRCLGWALTLICGRGSVYFTHNNAE